MKRRYCKNGKIHLKTDMFDCIDETESALINAYYLSDNGDTMLLASGYDYFEFYNVWTDKKYLITDSDAERLLSGRRIILYPQPLDEWDIEFLATEYEYIVE